MPPDAVVQLAVDTFFEEDHAADPTPPTGSIGSDATTGEAERPDLWFVGLASSRDARPIRTSEPGLSQEIARAVWEDSFGGMRPWTEPDEDEASPIAPDDRPDPSP